MACFMCEFENGKDDKIEICDDHLLPLIEYWRGQIGIHPMAEQIVACFVKVAQDRKLLFPMEDSAA